MKHSTVFHCAALLGALVCAIVCAIALSARAQHVEGRESSHNDSGAPLIVIDPGHGGGNTGAPTVDAQLREKHITLALARTLGARLRAAGYQVIATRDRDEYLTLRQRVAFANEQRADLFISLHANATETHAQRGHETFILSRRGVDVDGRALRIDDGAPRAGVDERLALVLDDVERGLAQPLAADLASRIQARMRVARPTSDDRGVRQDVMHVLLGATMPAVLVEVGFGDHSIEGPELLDPAVQSEICAALTLAIRDTLPVSTVDNE